MYRGSRGDRDLRAGLARGGLTMTNRLERLALQQRLRIGAQRRILLKILDQARGPLTAREVYQRAQASRQPVSLSTIQHTLSRLTAAGLLRRVAAGGRKAWYEKAHGARRESLIDTATGDRLEFRSEGIEGLLQYAVRQLGYRLIDYQLELFGLPDGGPDPHLGEAPEQRSVGTVPARSQPQENGGATHRSRRRGRH